MASTSTISLSKMLLTIVFACFASAISVCDVVNAHSALQFCNLLNNNPTLRAFNNQTSNITVLAFTDDAFYGSSIKPGAGGDMIPVMQYHIIRGMYSSITIKNAIGSTDGKTSSLLLKTYLEDGKITGGQKIEASEGSNNGGMLFGGTYDTTAHTITLDIAFDGGIIHIIDSVLTFPGSLRQELIKMSSHGSLMLTEALYTSELMGEIELLQDATVLAPPDSEFYRVGSIFDGMSKENLRALLGYHVLVGNVTYISEIVDGPQWTWLAETLSGKTVNVSHIGWTVTFNEVFDDESGDRWIANGNMIFLKSILDPDNRYAAQPFPNAKNAETGQPLFNNIIDPYTQHVPTSTSDSSLTYSSDFHPAQGSGISTGARVGILVGVVGSVLMLLLLGVWLLFRRQRKLHLKENMTNSEEEASSGTSAEDRGELVEDTGPGLELHGQTVGPELPGNDKNHRHELR